MPIPAGYSQGSGGWFFKDDGTGPYAIGSDGSIHLVRSSRDFFMDVSFGIVEGYTRVIALGNNPDVDIASLPEDVWSGGGVYPWMTAATALEIVSSSASDTAAGTGARTVLINGLDINYDPVVQVVTLNGTEAAALPTNIFRINSALIMSAGSEKINAGTLTVRDAGGGTTRAVIPLGYGITKQSQYTVPAGFTLSINSSLFSINKTGGTDRLATVASFVQSSSGFYRMPLELSISRSAPYRHDGIPGIFLPQKTDFGFRVTDVTSDNTNVTAAWLGILRENSLS